MPNSPSQNDIANFFRKSWYFSCYEDSSLITESLLCGCPVMLIKNKFFDGSTLANEELGTYGCFSSENVNNIEKNIEKAYEEIPLAIKKYYESVNNFKISFKNFIDITQRSASKHDFPKDFKIENFMPKIKREEYLIKKFFSDIFH